MSHQLPFTPTIQCVQHYATPGTMDTYKRKWFPFVDHAIHRECPLFKCSKSSHMRTLSNHREGICRFKKRPKLTKTTLI